MLKKPLIRLPLGIIGCFTFFFLISSCTNKKSEDRIIYDLNEIFDPRHEGNTDWNYTEIDQEWMAEAGLYYDENIHEFRQKNEYSKKFEQRGKKRNHKPMNPITGHLIQLIAVWLAMNGFILYGAYVQSIKLHRRSIIWMINCLIGGVPAFIVLSLSPALRFNKDLEFREESDLLGIMMFCSNLSVVIILYICYSAYKVIVENPQTLIDFIGK